MAKLIGDVAPFDVTEVVHPAHEFLAEWINLPKSGRKVLGTNLNRSEARGVACCRPQKTEAGPQRHPRQIVHRRSSSELRQVFMAGPDDELVDGGPLRITGGGRYVITGGQKR